MTRNRDTRDRRERGEGTWLPRTKAGLYRLQVSLGVNRDGTRDRRVFTARTKKEARALAAEALAKKQAGLAAVESRMPLADYLDVWLEGRRGRIKANTYDSYEEIIRLHVNPAIGRVRLSDLRRTHIDRVMTAIRDKQLSARRANMARAVLHLALGEAEDDELVVRNPVARVKRIPHKAQKGDPLTVAEVTRLLLHVRDTRWYPLYLTTVMLGLRQGEVLGLQWEDVHADYLYVRRNLQWDKRERTFRFETTKTEESTAVLPLPANVRQALALQRTLQDADRERAGEDWQGDWPALVFRNRQGRPYHNTSITHQFQKDLAAAGIRRRRFHDLRHSTSEVLHAQGVSDRTIQAILRHASIATTLGVYTQPDPALVAGALAELAAIFGSETNGNPVGNAGGGDTPTEEAEPQQ